MMFFSCVAIRFELLPTCLSHPRSIDLHLSGFSVSVFIFRLVLVRFVSSSTHSVSLSLSLSISLYISPSLSLSLSSFFPPKEQRNACKKYTWTDATAWGLVRKVEGTMTREARTPAKIGEPTRFLPTSHEMLAKNTPGHTPRPGDPCEKLREP